MVLRMPFCSAASGLMRRLAVRVRVLRLVRGRMRMRVSGGAVRAELSVGRNTQRTVGLLFSNLV